MFTTVIIGEVVEILGSNITQGSRLTPKCRSTAYHRGRMADNYTANDHHTDKNDVR